MKHHLTAVLYVLAMVAIIVGVDFLFLRNHFWAAHHKYLHRAGLRRLLLRLPPPFLINARQRA